VEAASGCSDACHEAVHLDDQAFGLFGQPAGRPKHESGRGTCLVRGLADAADVSGDTAPRMRGLLNVAGNFRRCRTLLGRTSPVVSLIRPLSCRPNRPSSTVRKSTLENARRTFPRIERSSQMRKQPSNVVS
jgi:hypothetical protein